MPHATMKLIPGIDTNETPALNEAAFSGSQLIRFFPDRMGKGLIQKLGGWTNWAPNTNIPEINELHAWEDLSGVQRLAVGATNSLSTIQNNSGKTPTTLTPQTNASDIGLTTTVSQTVAAYVAGTTNTIQGSTANWQTGTAVYFSTAGGGTLPTGITANQVYWIINSAIGATTFQISATPPGTTQTAVSLVTTGSGTTTVFISPVACVNGSSTVYFTDTNLSVRSGVTFSNDGSGKLLVTATTTPVSGTPIYFTTTGSFSGTNVSAGTPYYVLPISGNTTQFNISATSGGTAVSYGSAGTGTISLYNPDQIRSGFNINIQTPISIANLLLSGVYTVTGQTLGNNFYSVYTIDAGKKANATSVGVATSLANGPLLPAFALTANVSTVTVTEYNQPYINQQTGTFLYPTTSSGITIYGNYIVTLDSTNPSYRYTINTSTPSTATVSSLYMNNGNIHIVYYYNVPSLYGASGYGSGQYGGYAGTTTTQTGCTISGTTLTLGGSNSSVAIGQLVTGGTITANNQGLYPYITGGSGTTWTLSFSPGTISSFTATFSQSVVGYGLGQRVTYPQGIPVSNVSDWVINNFGEILIANPQGGAIYYWSPTNNSADAQLLSTAPLVNQGIFVAMPARQIVAYGSTATGIQDPLLVRWSDAADATVWIAQANNQAGSYRIPEGSAIIGALQGPQQALIWTDLAVWAMQYVGLPEVYGFNKLADGMGLIGKKAAGIINGDVYWMSPEKFCVLSSGGPKPIQCPIWDKVYQNVNTDQYSLIRCAVNSTFGEITWYYPTVGSGYNNAYVKYNVNTQAWDYGSLTRTAWIDQSVLGTPIGSSTDGYIYQHESGFNAGSNPMNCWFQTGYMQLNEADNLVFVDQIWPDFKWVTASGTSTSATLYVTLYGANYPGDTPIQYGPYTMTSNVEYISTRFRHRLMSIYVSSYTNTNTADTNSFWRIGAVRYRYQLDGKF